MQQQNSKLFEEVPNMPSNVRDLLSRIGSFRHCKADRQQLGEESYTTDLHLGAFPLCLKQASLSSQSTRPGDFPAYLLEERVLDGVRESGFPVECDTSSKKDASVTEAIVLDSSERHKSQCSFAERGTKINSCPSRSRRRSSKIDDEALQKIRELVVRTTMNARSHRKVLRSSSYDGQRSSSECREFFKPSSEASRKASSNVVERRLQRHGSSRARESISSSSKDTGVKFFPELEVVPSKSEAASRKKLKEKVGRASTVRQGKMLHPSRGIFRSKSLNTNPGEEKRLDQSAHKTGTLLYDQRRSVNRTDNDLSVSDNEKNPSDVSERLQAARRAMRDLYVDEKVQIRSQAAPLSQSLHTGSHRGNHRHPSSGRCDHRRRHKENGLSQSMHVPKPVQGLKRRDEFVHHRCSNNGTKNSATYSSVLEDLVSVAAKYPGMLSSNTVSRLARQYSSGSSKSGAEAQKLPGRSRCSRSHHLREKPHIASLRSSDLKTTAPEYYQLDILDGSYHREHASSSVWSTVFHDDDSLTSAAEASDFGE